MAEDQSARLDHPPIDDDSDPKDFTPVTTSVSCDPKGNWFKINWRSGIGKTMNRSDTYMFRENVQRLRDQLNEVLEATSNGKILESGTLDPEEAKRNDAARRKRLAAKSEKPAKKPKARKGATETPKNDTDSPDVEPEVRKGEAKAARIQQELAKEDEE